MRREPLSAGRRTRSIPPSVRRALSNRDRGCRFPGCPATRRLHGHHVRHRAEGGETSLDNLVLLCPTHHRLVHEGGFDVERRDDGAFRFTNHYAVAIRPPRSRETSSSDIIVLRNESLGLAIDCEIATAHWHGERIDHDHALMTARVVQRTGHDVQSEAEMGYRAYAGGRFVVSAPPGLALSQSTHRSMSNSVAACVTFPLLPPSSRSADSAHGRIPLHCS